MLISKEWEKIIDKVELNLVGGEINVIELIKNELVKWPQYRDLYLNWQRSDFDIDYKFRVRGFPTYRLLDMAILKSSYNTVSDLIQAGANVNLHSVSVYKPILLACLQKDSRYRLVSQQKNYKN